MNVILICPICGKAFFDDEVLRLTCSRKCNKEIMRLEKHEREELIAEAEKKKGPPRADCRSYNKVRHDCNGLNALWCTVGECKFYKPRAQKG